MHFGKLHYKNLMHFVLLILSSTSELKLVHSRILG